MTASAPARGQWATGGCQIRPAAQPQHALDERIVPIAVVVKVAAAEQEMHDAEEHDDVMAEHRRQPESGNPAC